MYNNIKLVDANENPRQTTIRLGYQCPEKNYHWAELKSSIAVKNIMRNGIANRLLETWQIILNNIFLPQNLQPPNPVPADFVQPTRDNLIDAFIVWNQNLINNNNRMLNDLFFYPVGGNFETLIEIVIAEYNLPDGDGIVNARTMLTNNLYGIYNFLRWFITVYIMNLNQINHHHIEEMDFFKLIKGVWNTLNSIYKAQESIRGNRVDENNAVYSSQIGITELQYPELLRDPRYNNNRVINDIIWNHPGQRRCNMQYTGHYGAKIKDAREHNDERGYGSLQCGISGSVHFTLLPILMSIIYMPTLITNDHINRFVQDLFYTAFIFLTGDGGHNMHEIVYGLTIDAICLRTFWSNNITNFLNILLRNIDVNGNVNPLNRFELPINHPFYPFCLNFFDNNNNNRFQNLTNFINTLYQYTQDINPTVDFRPIDNINYGQEQINFALRFLVGDNYLQNDESNTIIRRFLATENLRYMKNEENANIFIARLIDITENGLINGIDTFINNEKRACNQRPNAQETIFAFEKNMNSSRRVKKSVRKSSRRVRKSSRRVRKSSKRVIKSSKRVRKSVKKGSRRVKRIKSAKK